LIIYSNKPLAFLISDFTLSASSIMAANADGDERPRKIPKVSKQDEIMFCLVIVFMIFEILRQLKWAQFFTTSVSLIHFDPKNVFFLSICGCGSNWWKKCCVHC
jgi:hypothetical protein